MSCANGYCTSRRIRLSATRPDSLQKSLFRPMVWTIMRSLHQLPNLLLFAQYSLSLLTIIGQSTCLISTVLSLMGNLMTIKKYSWSNHLAMKNLIQRNSVSSCTSQSMDLNKLDTNGMRSYAACSQTWDLKSARPTQPSSIFKQARIINSCYSHQ